MMPSLGGTQIPSRGGVHLCACCTALQDDYIERIKCRAPVSLKWLDGKPITVDSTNMALIIKLAFKQKDGDQF